MCKFNKQQIYNSMKYNWSKNVRGIVYALVGTFHPNCVAGDIFTEGEHSSQNSEHSFPKCIY